MTPDALLARMAGTLRAEIGPAVAEPFAKTQAFMAAVILEKLARQLALAAAHAAADDRDRAELVAAIEAQLGPADAPGVHAALGAVRTSGDAGLRSLVGALYEARQELGSERFDSLLARVRLALRARLDRQLEHAA